MPWFEIHTEEIVHGVYSVEAYDENDARKQFVNGHITKPVLYEAQDVEITEVNRV